MPSDHNSPPNTLVMVAAAMLACMVSIVLARMAYGLILPDMRDGLGFSDQQAGQLGTVTALGYLVFVLPGGWAATRWGARRTVLGGLGLISLGFAGLALAANWWVIAGLMLLLGLGTAFCFAPMLSLIATWYPSRRGLMIGWMTTGIGIGLLLSGLLVPPLMQWVGVHGWRASWAVFGLMALAAMALVWWGVRDPPASAAAAPADPAAPPDRWRVYRNRRVLTVALAYAVIGGVHIVHTLFMFSFVVASGIASTTAGQLFALSGTLSVLCAPLWGWLSDRWGRGSSMLLAMGMVTLALALPLLWQSLPVFVLHYVVMGLGAQGAFTMVQASSTEQVAPQDIPVAISLVTVFYAGGQFIGPALASPLIEARGFPVVLVLCCLLMLGGLVLAWRIRGFGPLPHEPARD